MKTFFAIIFYCMGSHWAFCQAGMLDLTFDTDGLQTIHPGNVCNAMVIQPDGKILLAGTGSTDVTLVRLNPDGSPDNTFNSDGISMADVNGMSDVATSVAIRPDGKIVIAGVTNNGSDNDILLMGFTQAGFLDHSFGENGITYTQIGPGTFEYAHGMILQPDGKIVVVGQVGTGAGSDFVLVRYLPDGSQDLSFGPGSVVTTSFSMYEDIAYALMLQPDGKLIAVGSTRPDSLHPYMAVARYNTDGSPDSSFGTNGKVMTLVGSNPTGYACALQPDNKIVVVGNGWNGVDDDFAIVRYNADGSLDTTFSTDGKQTVDIGSPSEGARTVAIQPDGKIILAGYTFNGIDYDFALTRLTPSGNLDSSFDADGKLTTQFNPVPGHTETASCMALQTDGKIVVAGTVSNTFGVARYWPLAGMDVENAPVVLHNLQLYPNPVMQKFTIHYFLSSAENISIDLLDSRGSMISCLVPAEKQETGDHDLSLMLPNGISAGTYYVMISTSSGRSAIKLMVN